jgi:hypothetical protein
MEDLEEDEDFEAFNMRQTKDDVPGGDNTS